MGQQQSKDELLYQQVNYGNVDGIKALRSQGAGLEWIDNEGKTALIAACMNAELFNVATTLIELGANVNAYRPGRHAGTPLHHAAKRGLERTVKLLLSHGANALVMNDDCQTPLDVARTKGYTNVVRALEGHLCLFSGWLKELYGPSLLGLLAPQFLSRKVWVVILPCGSRNLRKPLKLELAVYTKSQDPQPRTVIPLWKTNLEEPSFNQSDPAAVISNFSGSTQIKLAAISESEKHQLQRFCSACKGIPQEIHQLFPSNQAPTAPAANVEDDDLNMAINASLQSVNERPSSTDTYIGSGVDAATSTANSMTKSGPAYARDESGSKCAKIQEEGSSGSSVQNIDDVSAVFQPTPENPSGFSPSAPPVDDGPIVYPSIDMSPLDLSPSTVDGVPTKPNEMKDNEATSMCTICLDAPLQGACIPCGHMAGCMSCLNEIKGKNWGCPVCRAKIDQVIRIYAV